jgi:MYXO-CTERM domain-containing protein
VLGAVELVAPDADVRTNDIQWLVKVPRVRPVFRVATDLKQVPPYQWRAREDEGEAVELPADPDSERFLFTYAVQDDAEAPLAVTLRFVAAPDRDSEPWIFVLAVLALAFVTRRRAKRQPMGAADIAALVVGVGGLVLVATLWRLDIEDGVAAMVVLLAVGWFSRVKRPNEAADEDLD